MTDRDRLRSELSKLRTLQPDLTHDQALSFFAKFTHADALSDIEAVLAEEQLPSVNQPALQRGPSPKPSPPRRPRDATEDPSAQRSNHASGPSVVAGRSSIRPTAPAKAKSEGALQPRPGKKRRKQTTVDPSKLGLCPVCQTQVRLSPQGKLQRHTQRNDGFHACLGAGKKPAGGPESATGKTPSPTEDSGRREFADRSGHPKGELAPSDIAWIAGQRWLVSLADATPADVVTARRILLAAANGHVDADTATAVSEWYQAMKRRPDLFDPRKKAPRWKGAEGDPEKRLGKPSSPGKKIYYREVLVGKRS